MGIKMDIASGWYVNRLAVGVSCVKRDVTVSIVPSHVPIKADHQPSVSRQGECAAGRATMCFVVACLCIRQRATMCFVVAGPCSRQRATMCFVVAGPCSRQSHRGVCCCRSVQQAGPPCVLLLPLSDVTGSLLLGSSFPGEVQVWEHHWPADEADRLPAGALHGEFRQEEKSILHSPS